MLYFIGETTSGVDATPAEIDGTYASCLECNVDSSSESSSSSEGNSESSSSSDGGGSGFSLVASGAGTTGVNGTYNWDGMGLEIYTHTGGIYEIHETAPVWGIFLVSGGPPLYGTTVPGPPTNAYSVITGVGPAPTVV